MLPPDVNSLSTAWFPGAPIGRYQLITPLASGGMAEIWLARQPGLRGFEKVVVIKRMVGALEEDPEHVEMFVSEARLAAGLSHQHVVQIFELGQEHGSFYIVMEFIDGESMSTVWKEGLRKNKPMAGPLVAQLIAWAAEGLHYAHTRTGQNGEALCIVHRDVSPQNLLVTYDGSMKLVDFGIAKVANQATLSGKLKGKLAYMSPEQGRTEPLDARSDIYSLGVVLFEVVTRSRLFPKLEDLEILKAVVSGQSLPRAQERRPDVPDALDRIIAKAMAPRREDRFATAREMQVALEDWLLKTGRRTTGADIADYMQSLFAERIEQRRALIESAMRGELTPGRVPSRAFPGASGAESTDSASALPPTAASPRGGGTGELPLSFAPARGRGLDWRVLAAGGAAVAASVVVAVLAAGSAGGPTDAATDSPALVPAHTILAVESKPRGAHVVIDGIGRGATPLELPDLEPGEHQLLVAAEGYISEQRTVSVKAVAERVTQVISLVKEVPAVVEVAAPKVDAGRPVAVARATGKLNLATTPWTTVYLGSRKLGDTPLVGYPLPVGKHVLTLVNQERSINVPVEVEINATEPTIKRMTLQ
jgi:eukaryotic-like serine/threonine-protein kinase